MQLPSQCLIKTDLKFLEPHAADLDYPLHLLFHSHPTLNSHSSPLPSSGFHASRPSLLYPHPFISSRPVFPFEHFMHLLSMHLDLPSCILTPSSPVDLPSCILTPSSPLDPWFISNPHPLREQIWNLFWNCVVYLPNALILPRLIILQTNEGESVHFPAA